METERIESIIESVLFASGDPFPAARLAALLDLPEEEIFRAAESMENRYRFENRGIRLLKLEDSLQLCTAAENADWVRRALDTRKPARLSQAALEVLAIAAYFQPVTRTYIEQIRTVDSSYTVSLLEEKGFLEPCGKLDAPGRPTLFRTTDTFLRVFGLSSLDDLPALDADGTIPSLTPAPETETAEAAGDGIVPELRD